MPEQSQPRQLLHLVFGGELADLDSIEFRDLRKLDIVGIYPNYAAAYAAWKAKAQQTVDNAVTKIVQAGRVAGTLVNAGNVERYTRLGVRAVMTSFFPWIQAGATELIDRAAAGARR